MKVLLIIPPVSKIVQKEPPLGILYIASYLREKIPEVNLFLLDYNLNAFNTKSFIESLKKIKPDIVGITAKDKRSSG